MSNPQGSGIDRKKKVTVYRQIYDILKRELAEGVYDAVEVLPSERLLCERFGVERNTVRKALEFLVEDGLAVKAPGYGTKILRESPAEAPAKFAQLRQNILLFTRETDPLGSKMEYFHLKLMRVLERKIYEMGYNLICKTLSPEVRLEDVIAFTCPAAVLFDSYFQKENYQQVLGMGIPCLSINHYTPLLTSVVSNNFDGAYRVARRMAEAGHRNIALITGKMGHQTTMERLSGFRSLYLEKNLSQNLKYVYQGDWMFDSGAAIGEQILTLPKEERPTAVFAFNDDLAYGCLSSLEKHGFSMPEEISLVGFDHSDRYEGIFRLITTVDVNIEDMVQYACWCLDGQIKRSFPRALAKIQVETILVDNGTIRKIPEE